MIHESTYELRKSLAGVVKIAHGQVEVLDEARLRASAIDGLIRSAVFGSPAVKELAQWLIWECGQALGVCPASIHDFYIACGQQWSGRTVPAMNIRFTTYETARAALRAAIKHDVGAFIFEIARSEMGYTDQPPAEYSAALIAAAIKENYTGPLFIQGDHFQVKASLYAKEPEKAIDEVKDLIREAIPAGFWNIDIDTSTLVTLAPATLDEQQYHNYTRSAELTRLVREMEPAGVTVSLGGEIGEVGEKNSTPEELDAYMTGYRKALGDDLAGLSKVSVQTGTSHGGVVLPDGSIKDVAVDFDTLKVLSERAKVHGAGGAVQHGASTLPKEMFHKFPEIDTLEIHLATGFQNIFMDHPAFPADLKKQIYAYLDSVHGGSRKPTQTDAQFYYSERKRALGAFKAELWALPPEAAGPIYQTLEEEFAFFFDQLNVTDTRKLIDQLVSPVAYHQPMPQTARLYGDDQGLAD
jgi:fructose/tagatose bisphosphate aldolase